MDDDESYRRRFSREVEEGSIKQPNVLFYKVCSFDVRLIIFFFTRQSSS